MKKIAVTLLTLLTVFSFVGATPVDKIGHSMTVSNENISYKISDELYGLFIEDISYACDGGLVSNLVNNNSFEYTYKNTTGWNIKSDYHNVSSETPINENNPNYLKLRIKDSGYVENIGFTELYDYKTFDYNSKTAFTPDMGFTAGEEYEFSAYFKNIDFDGKINVMLNAKGNTEKYPIDIENFKEWTKITVKLTSEVTDDGSLLITFDGYGTLLMDFVSLVPTGSHGYGEEQWKYVTLRADLYDALNNLSPSFIRFPGGCLAEGDSLDNLYNWKNTIGPLENRKQTYNLWRDDANGRDYINSNSMGYHEYFTLCDELGATPIPVVNAGLICQGRSGYNDNLNKYKNEEITEKEWQEYLGKVAYRVGTEEWNSYVQDILDLIEYANGDTSTIWGAVRAENGHPEPFNLKYIAIGNENWGEIYWENFRELYKAVKQAYPDVKVVTTAGCWLEGEDFEFAWNIANKEFPDTIVDEHYYTVGGYLLGNTHRYDNYERTGAKVFVGEYAPKADGVGTIQTKSNIWAAVENAAYLTGIERNSDVVQMISYAPTLAKNNAQCWEPNMIWFDSQEVALSPDYYTQMLFANNMGTNYVSTDFNAESEGIYQCTTVDTENQVIYVKVVNSTNMSDKFTVNVEGFDNVNNPSLQYMSANFKAACNEIGEKLHVAPREKSLEVKDNSVQFELEKYSVNVIRIPYGNNDGTDLYKLPEIGIISPFIHPAIEIAVPGVLGLIILLTGGIILLVRVIHHKKVRKNK